MEKKRPVGVIIIGVLEMLFGLVGCLFLGRILVDMIRLNGQIGFGWLALPLIAAWALMLPLGVIMFMQKRVAWFVHIILIPLIILVILAAWTSIRLDVRIVTSIPLILCIFVLYYLTRPKIKEQFK